jgi:hypothetical protein
MLEIYTAFFNPPQPEMTTVTNGNLDSEITALCRPLTET